MNTKEVGRFIRFALVGASGTILDFVLLILFKEWLKLPLLLANSLSYSAGIINNYSLNRLWTYPDSRQKRLAWQLGQFAVVSVIGLLLNNLIVLGLEEPLGKLLNTPRIGYLAAKIVATGLVVFWNFFINRYWTFNDVE